MGSLRRGRLGAERAHDEILKKAAALVGNRVSKVCGGDIILHAGLPARESPGIVKEQTKNNFRKWRC